MKFYCTCTKFSISTQNAKVSSVKKCIFTKENNPSNIHIYIHIYECTCIYYWVLQFIYEIYLKLLDMILLAINYHLVN